MESIKYKQVFLSSCRCVETIFMDLSWPGLLLWTCDKPIKKSFNYTDNLWSFLQFQIRMSYFKMSSFDLLLGVVYSVPYVWNFLQIQIRKEIMK